MFRWMYGSLFVVVAMSACALSTTAENGHGTISTLSAASGSEARFCEHRVPMDVCTRHNPALIPNFKQANDWCAEHGVPESQCYECHPDLSFAPLPALPEGADVERISAKGEDVPDLAKHLARGKITVFDFYADWCAPCRTIDAHMVKVLSTRQDVALRKLNIVSWDTPLAKRYLANVEALPYVVVYGRGGRRVAAIAGLKLEELDHAIAKGALL